ncbi:MAG: helix-turn-helix transcriptional regulator [Muribaculaceae bacterium]|nr:helix-turn-helix transcriptional regulator [Muribaculaceae bacterium]
MKNIGNELKRLIEEKRLVKKDLAAELGITPTYLSAIMRKESIDCSLLNRICTLIGVSPSHFFDDDASVSVSNVKATTVIGNANAAVTITANEVSALRELLKEKERTIQILLAQTGTVLGQKQ